MNKKKALFTSLAALALASTQAQTFADEVDVTIAEPTVAEVPAADEVAQDAPAAEVAPEESVEEVIAEEASVEADLLMTTYAATDVAEETPVAAGAEGTATLTLAEVLEGAELDASLPGFFYAAEGTFVPDRERQVYNYPDLNEPVVATYQAGEAINFDRVGTHPGIYIWVSYQSDSGIRRYVKVGNDGAAAWIFDENGNQIGKEPLFGDFVATTASATENKVLEEPVEQSRREQVLAQFAQGDFSAVAGTWSQRTDSPLVITIRNDGTVTGSSNGFITADGEFKLESQSDSAHPIDFTFLGEEVVSSIIGEGVIEVASEDVINSWQPVTGMSAEAYNLTRPGRYYRLESNQATIEASAIEEQIEEKQTADKSTDTPSTTPETSSTEEPKDVATEKPVVEDVNPYEAIYAETISSFETYPEYREGVSKEYALVDIDGNGVPELIFGTSAQGFAAVYTIDAGQVVPVAQEVNGQPRGGVGIASNGDIVHVAVQSVGQGLYVTSIYRLRPEGGFDLIERQEFQVGDGQASIIADYTFLSWDDLTPWTATKSEVGQNDAVEMVQTVTQTPQLTTGDIVHVPLTAKTEPAVAPAKESKPAKETYSRAEKAQSDKGILPETGEVTSVLGAIGASLSMFGLAGLRRRNK